MISIQLLVSGQPTLNGINSNQNRFSPCVAFRVDGTLVKHINSKCHLDFIYRSLDGRILWRDVWYDLYLLYPVVFQRICCIPTNMIFLVLNYANKEEGVMTTDVWLNKFSTDFKIFLVREKIQLLQWILKNYRFDSQFETYLDAVVWVVFHTYDW